MSTYHQLSQEERYIITGLRVSRHSKADIARVLGRSPSTISRELIRNKKLCDGKYRADEAYYKSIARRRRVRRGFHHTVQQWDQVVLLLKEKWSPEQISNCLKLHGSFTISHETIYKYILHDKKNGGTLFTYLRIIPKVRKKRYNSKDSRGILPGKRHISTRPYEVETRKVLGHWEGDTVMGSDLHHCILTLVERKSGLVIIKKMNSRTAAEVIRAAVMAIKEHEAHFKTLTLDNGTEFQRIRDQRATPLAFAVSIRLRASRGMGSRGEPLKSQFFLLNQRITLKGRLGGPVAETRESRNQSLAAGSSVARR